jgi:hypothetical protein
MAKPTRGAKRNFIWRTGIIYAYSVLDPRTGERDDWAYVGKTRQLLSSRHNQHMDSQPWSDLYPQVRVIFTFKRCPDWWLTFAEKSTIWYTRPTYNFEYNTRNPYRIPKYQAVKERADRDLRGRKVRGRMFM